MKDSSKWFESPRPQPHHFASSSLPKDSQPDSPLLKQHLPHQPLALRHEHNYGLRDQLMQDQCEKHGEYCKKQQGIRERMVFSEEEEEMTPRMEEGEQKYEKQTSGRKSGIIQVKKSSGEKKSRPRQTGLRELSGRVLRLMAEIKEGGYKDVSVELLKEYRESLFIEQGGSEEMNIKRRVYDALNVFISLGLLNKNGRKIVADQNGKGNSLKISKQEIHRLRDKLEITQKVLAQKRHALQQANGKYQKLGKLLRKNQQQSKNETKQQKIRFPLIGILLTQGWQLTLLQQTQVILSLKHQANPFGDLDCIRWL